MVIRATGVGVYPGSFNPPTTAHLAVADAARRHHRLERIDLAVSTVTLAKEDVVHPRFDDRLAVLGEVVADHDWLELVVTDDQLLVDIARGYDLLILGADKWDQIHQVHWYGSPEDRDRVLAALPAVAVAPREGFTVEADLAIQLDGHHTVSSTRARSGEVDLMAPAAARFAQQTGAWIDPDRYDRWVAAQ